MAVNQMCCFLRQNWVSVSVTLFHLSRLLLLQDVWLRGEAYGQRHRERVSPVCRDGPRAAGCGHRQLYQQSHVGTTAAQMRELENLKLDYWGSGGEMLIWFLMKCVSVWLHLCSAVWLLLWQNHCSVRQSIAYMSVYRANGGRDKPKTELW